MGFKMNTPLVTLFILYLHSFLRPWAVTVLNGHIPLVGEEYVENIFPAERPAGCTPGLLCALVQERPSCPCFPTHIHVYTCHLFSGHLCLTGRVGVIGPTLCYCRHAWVTTQELSPFRMRHTYESSHSRNLVTSRGENIPTYFVNALTSV